MPSQRLVRILSVCIFVLFILNILLIPLVPALVVLGSTGRPVMAELIDLFTPPDEGVEPLFDASPLFWLVVFSIAAWRTPYSAVLSAFLMVCGVCTAVILWQARLVVRTLREGKPFQRSNVRALRRAAVCSFAISGMALARLVYSCFFYAKSVAPLFSYNGLFVPVFLLGGLLCLVMSSLFGQAAALREENDLTI